MSIFPCTVITVHGDTDIDGFHPPNLYIAVSDVANSYRYTMKLLKQPGRMCQPTGPLEDLRRFTTRAFYVVMYEIL